MHHSSLILPNAKERALNWLNRSHRLTHCLRIRLVQPSRPHRWWRSSSLKQKQSSVTKGRRKGCCAAGSIHEKRAMKVLECHINLQARSLWVEKPIFLNSTCSSSLYLTFPKISKVALITHRNIIYILFDGTGRKERICSAGVHQPTYHLILSLLDRSMNMRCL
jgi:hypothetical protein